MRFEVKERRSQYSALLAFTLGATLTFFIFTNMRSAENSVVDTKFFYSAHQSIAFLKKEVSTNIERLRALTVFISTTENLDRITFEHFTRGFTRNNPSIKSLAWAPLVLSSQRQDFERKIREEGYSDFQIIGLDKQRNRIRALNRDTYFPIFFLEPQGSNFRALGFDLGSTPKSKAALDEALKSKSTAASPFLVLVQEDSQQKSILLIDPVFLPLNRNKPDEKVLSGYAILAMRMVDLLQKVSKDWDSNLDITVLEKKPDATLLGSERLVEKQVKGRHLISDFAVLNKIWQITVKPSSKFHPQRGLKPSTFFLILGLALSVLLAFRIWRLLHKKYYLQAELADKTRLLKSSEERYSLTVKGNYMGIWEWPDVSKEEEYWSPSYYSLIGYSKGELPASFSSFQKMLHPADRERILKLQQAHFDNSTQYDLEYRLLTKHRGYRWFRTSGHSARDINGVPLRMLGTMQDINEEKTATAKLGELLEIYRQSADQFHALLEGISEAIIIMDDNGKILQFSRSAQKMFGYEGTAMIGKNINVLLPPQDAGEKDNFQNTDFQNFLGPGHTLAGKKNSGVFFTLQLKMTAIESTENHFIAMVQDLSELKKTEQEQSQKFTKLLRSNKELEYFSQIANNSLRIQVTEINKILNQFVTQTRLATPENPVSQLHYLKNRISDFAHLLSKQLIFTTSNSPRIKTELIDLNPFVEDIADSLDKGKLIIEITRLPIVEASVVELNILFRNILDYFINNNEKEAGFITISCSENEEFYQFSIIGDGLGIQTDMRQDIFPLSRAQDLVDKQDMDLALVKKIIEANAGYLAFPHPEHSQQLEITIDWPKTDRKIELLENASPSPLLTPTK